MQTERCKVKVVVNPIYPASLKVVYELEAWRHKVRLRSRSLADAEAQIRALRGRLPYIATARTELEFSRVAGAPMSAELRQAWREALGIPEPIIQPAGVALSAAVQEAVRYAGARPPVAAPAGQPPAGIKSVRELEAQYASILHSSASSASPAMQPAQPARLAFTSGIGDPEEERLSLHVETIRRYIVEHGGAPDLTSRKPAAVQKIRNYMASTLVEPGMTVEWALKIAERVEKGQGVRV
jgi:hypothetical protein